MMYWTKRTGACAGDAVEPLTARRKSRNAPVSVVVEAEYASQRLEAEEASQRVEAEKASQQKEAEDASQREETKDASQQLEAEKASQRLREQCSTSDSEEVESRFPQARDSQNAGAGCLRFRPATERRKGEAGAVPQPVCRPSP